MQDYVVKLTSPVSSSFRCQKAADSLDIDVKAKSLHELKVRADLETDFNIGLIVGSSGSGKSTLAQKVWGEDCFKGVLDMTKPIIEQFPEEFTYDECSEALLGMGLTSVPCWIRPVYTLSTGQRARAEAALMLSNSLNDVVCIDEWTSTVDRTVAKVMSTCIAKYARRRKRKLVLVSCHFDILEWLQPDWVINCNDQTYLDYRHDKTEIKKKANFSSIYGKSDLNPGHILASITI